MGFGGSGGGGGTVAGSSDVALNNPADTQVLTYDGLTSKWKNAAAAGALVSSVAGKVGAVTLEKSDVGLGNVDNTSDLNKPISTATQTAINQKANIADLSSVATSGSYDDLTDKPSIPTVTGTNTGDQTLSVAGNNLTISGANGNTVVLPAAGGGTAEWGSVSGTLSAQSDLQSALDAKATKINLDQNQVPVRFTAGSGEWTGGVGISTSATVSTLARRSSSGTLAIASGVNATDAVTKAQLDLKLDAAQKAAINGVASLDAEGHVPTAQLATGTADDTTFLRGDGTWETVASGGGGQDIAISGSDGVTSFTEDSANPGTMILKTKPPLFNTALSFLSMGLSASAVVIGDSTGSSSDLGTGVNNNGANASWVKAFMTKFGQDHPDVTTRVRYVSGKSGTLATTDFNPPVTISTGTAGARYVDMPGAGSVQGLRYYRDAFNWDASLDLDVRVKIQPNSWATGTTGYSWTSTAGAGHMVGMFRTGGELGHGWAFTLAGSQLHFTHWNTSNGDVNSTAVKYSSGALPSPLTSASGATWVRATLDADNGSGGHVKTFYYSINDGATWVQISTQTIAGVASYSTTAWNTIDSGAHSFGVYHRFAGKIYEIDIRKGINGPTCGPVLPDQWAEVGSGNVLTGAPIFEIWNHSVVGSQTATHVAEMDTIRSHVGAVVTLISLSHNELDRRTEASWIARYESLAANAQTKNPAGSIVVVTQNPEASSYTYHTSHAMRNRILADLAKRHAWGCADLYADWLKGAADGTVTAGHLQGDGVHPSATGYTFLGQTLADYV